MFILIEKMAKSRFTETVPLKEDLKDVPLAAIAGGIYGGFSSLLDPLFIKRQFSMIRGNIRINTVRDYVFVTIPFLMYGLAWNHYINKIIESPKDPFNYVPLLTNGLSALVQGAYHSAKKRSTSDLEEQFLDSI